MTALSKSEIRRYMEDPEIEGRLVITPLIDKSEFFDPAAINVRLGSEFIIMKKQTFPILDIANKEEL